jgi:hypothetical protein
MNEGTVMIDPYEHLLIRSCAHHRDILCTCLCHEPTEFGEPCVLHMIACCQTCPQCKRHFVSLSNYYN